MELKKLLAEAHISQTQLAESLGVSKQYVNNIVSGRQEAGLQMLKQISELIKVPLWKFFYDETNIASPETATLTCPHCGKPIRIKLEK